MLIKLCNLYILMYFLEIDILGRGGKLKQREIEMLFQNMGKIVYWDRKVKFSDKNRYWKYIQKIW